MARRTRRTVNPHATGQRTALRVLGVILAGSGAILTAIGAIDFFSTLGTFGGGPDKFWCLMLGLPLLGVGIGLLKFGYLGTIGRYVAGETAPVAADTMNYMGERAAPGIRSVARSIAAGVGEAGSRVTCGACGEAADADARFCDQCGADLQAGRTCPACEAENDADARFCDRCGEVLRG